MQNSPNTGERSSKCVGATKLFSFPLQFWVLSTQNGFFFFNIKIDGELEKSENRKKSDFHF